jgi:hypothetical protein
VKLTDSQFLPYPEINDPGDGALDLQVLAEAIDAKLTQEFANFRSVLNNRQLEVVTLASDFGPISSGGTGITIGFDTVVFTSDGGGPTILFNPAITTGGIYAAGCYVISNPTGAVTANSYRKAMLQISLYNGPSVATFSNQTWSSEVYETTTGGEHQHVMAVFYAPFPAFSSVSVAFQHGNTGSTINVKTGSIMWLQRLGEVA